MWWYDYYIYPCFYLVISLPWPALVIFLVIVTPEIPHRITNSLTLTWSHWICYLWYLSDLSHVNWTGLVTRRKRVNEQDVLSANGYKQQSFNSGTHWRVHCLRWAPVLPADPEASPGLHGWPPQSGTVRYCMKDGSCSTSSGLWYMVRLAWVRTLLRHGDDILYLRKGTAWGWKEFRNTVIIRACQNHLHIRR